MYYIPFAERPLKRLESVGKLGPPYQSHQIQLYRYRVDSPSPIILCHWKSGHSIQVANVVKDLGILVDSSFSLSIHGKEAASKVRRVLFMIRQSFD